MAIAEQVYKEIKTLPPNRVIQILDFVEFIKQQENRNPVTGELRYNAETMTAIEEGDAMLCGDIPAKRYNSLEEMLVDL